MAVTVLTSQLPADAGQALRTGASPGDFAAEDYETTWTGRATLADLNDSGRSQLGLQPW